MTTNRDASSDAEVWSSDPSLASLKVAKNTLLCLFAEDQMTGRLGTSYTGLFASYQSENSQRYTKWRQGVMKDTDGDVIKTTQIMDTFTEKHLIYDYQA